MLAPDQNLDPAYKVAQPALEIQPHPPEPEHEHEQQRRHDANNERHGQCARHEEIIHAGEERVGG